MSVSIAVYGWEWASAKAPAAEILALHHASNEEARLMEGQAQSEGSADKAQFGNPKVGLSLGLTPGIKEKVELVKTQRK